VALRAETAKLLEELIAKSAVPRPYRPKRV
jgi:hypothetical protein